MPQPPDLVLAPSDSESRWRPSTTEEVESVREQLGRILASSMFRNSKRFPAFLRYTVEHALTSQEPLKERTIGHEVFGRDAAYDTAQAPVVRMAAGEVRKRLAQYYSMPEHHGELVIEYRAGSYLPEFHAPGRQTAPDGASRATASPASRFRLLAPLPLAAIACIVCVGLLSMIPMMRGRNASGSAAGAAGRFWAPIADVSADVLICIGDPVRRSLENGSAPAMAAQADDVTVEQFLRQNSVRYTDSVTLALLAGELRARGRPFRIRRPAATEFKDLREGPVVLIGGFNNPWTVKLGEGLRFTLADDPSGSYIRDRDNPDSRQWQGARSMRNLRQTYGLITRVQDPSTGQSILTVAGLVLGTRAAAECLIDSNCLDAAERFGRVSLDRTNVQIVVAAAVVGEDSGAPRVVAVHSW